MSLEQDFRGHLASYRELIHAASNAAELARPALAISREVARV
jgi:hypothetical protein